MAGMRLLVALSASLVLSMANAESPYDFATTPGKLPKQVLPSEYFIRIVPNIEKLTFSGS